MRKTFMVVILTSVLTGAVMTAMSGHSRSLAAEPATAPTVDPNLEENAFKDPRSGVQLRLPKGWVRKQGIADTGFQAPAKDRVQAGGLSPSIVLSKGAAPGVKPSDVDAMIADKRKQYAQVFAGYKDEEPSSVLPHIPNKGVGRIDYSFVLANVLPVRGAQIWIVEKDQVYTITCTSLSEAYVNNAKVFNAVIDTIAVP